MTPKEGQELNWAYTKAANQPNTTVQSVVDEETWQGVHPRNETYQTWESAPGARSGDFPGLSAREQASLHRNVLDVIVDAQERDRLLEAMGTTQQSPILRGPGVYKGQVTPGVTSRSVGAAPEGRISPVTAARVRANELVRGTVLGQDASAASMFPNTGKGPTSAITVRAPLTSANARKIDAAMRRVFGDDTHAIVNTDEGFVIQNISGNKNFVKEFNKYVRPDIEKWYPDSRITSGKRALQRGADPTSEYPEGLLYEELPWNEPGPSPVTHKMLEAIDDPAIPAMAQHADSPKMRTLMGDIASMRQRMAEKLPTLPNEKIDLLVSAWARGGLAEVRRLAAKGALPAIVVGVLSQMGEPSPPDSPGA